MRIIVAILSLLVMTGNAAAVDVAGVNLPPSIAVGGKTLTLNGYGIRKKFFFKIYVGALYTERRVTTTEELLKDPGDMVIRLVFIHGKVTQKQTVDTFSDSLAANAPEVVGTEDVRTFLSLFSGDLLKGDVVDLVLGADGTITVVHNGGLHGKFKSAKLSRAIPLIYVGPKPADDDLKKGMLGGK